MLGLMQDHPLLISSLIEFAAMNHGDEEIVSRTVEGPIHRYTYKDCAARSRQLAKALDKLGVEQSDRIATLAWNGYRHVEIYYGVSGMGAVCHTINPRLFPEQIVYIINHAEDQYIFMDLTFVPLIEAVVEQPFVSVIVTMCTPPSRRLAVLAVSPLSHVYVYGAVPPVAETVATPLLSPLHKMELSSVTAANNKAGSFTDISTEAIASHPFASVMVTW